MKSLVFTLIRLSFFIFVLLAVSCKKDVSIDDYDAVFSTKFNFSGFTSQATPLKSGAKSASSLGSLTENSESYLYFWSFNMSNSLPDIKFNHLLNPSIASVHGDLAKTYVNSLFNFESFKGGKAIVFFGTTEILIKMPIHDVQELTTLAFDMASTSTGAKEFDIYYSFDKGDQYKILQLNNKFSDPATSNKRHPYSYSLASLTDELINSNDLWIKIIPKEGNRQGAGIFNESTGQLRIDNLYLKGVPPVKIRTFVNKLHYFIFDSEGNEVIVSGENSWDNMEALELELALGKYQICFITNTSESELVIPPNLTLSSFYVSNLFFNSNAEIFGYIGDLVVNKEQSISIELERWFSQVKIEFTDGEALEGIAKIVVEQKHAPFFYAPFNFSMINPVTDPTTIEYEDEFSDSKHIIFNQFLGKLADSKQVSYDLHIYDMTGILKTVSLSSSIKNNMQLIFRGAILHGLIYGSDFAIFKNEDWNGIENVDF